MSRVLRAIARIAATLLAVLLLALLVVALVPFEIDLTRFKGLVEDAASKAAGREVAIDGGIRASTSLWPTLEMEGVRLLNPPGFAAGDLARMDEAVVQIELLPLLAFKLQVDEFRVTGLVLDLVRDGTGRANWVVERDDAPVEPEPPAQPAPEDGEGFDLKSLSGDALVIDELALENISVSYRSADMTEPLTFTLDTLEGSAPAGEPARIDANGTLLHEPFGATLKTSSLEALLRDNRADTTIEVEISGTRFEVGGLIDLNVGMRSARVSAAVEGSALHDLNGLLGVDLPPLRDYRARAEVTVTEEALALSDLELRVGGSSLAGTASLNRIGRRSFDARFVSPAIRLEDFDLGDWSPSAAQPAEAGDVSGEASTAEAEDTEPGSGDVEAQVVKLFDPEFLGRFDARIEIDLQKVSSGPDSLGAGSLVASLQDGRLGIGPLSLELPGGKLQLAVSVKPGKEASAASLRILVENFDLGVVARRKKPESKTEGDFSIDVDLESSSRNLDELLAGATGYLHFAAHPRNLESGIIDLWAVNVLSAVVSSSAEDADEPPESQINCVINHWKMNDGLLTTDSMIVDTSRIRICARGEVDFHEKTLKLVAAPTAKRPEFFSLATPIEVKGSFTDFGIGTYGAGIPETAIRFITSPVATPMLRAVKSDLPETGSDICQMPIGPSAVVPESYPGCRNP